MWSKIGSAILHFLHWCTGWIVHPDKGGCCQNDFNDVVDEFKNLKK